MLFTSVFRLLLDLYIKLLKQVAKHLNYFSYGYHKHSKLTYDWQKKSALLNFLYKEPCFPYLRVPFIIALFIFDIFL